MPDNKLKEILNRMQADDVKQWCIDTVYKYHGKIQSDKLLLMSWPNREDMDLMTLEKYQELSDAMQMLQISHGYQIDWSNWGTSWEQFTDFVIAKGFATPTPLQQAIIDLKKIGL